jgi:uncharacterized protein YacL (UPF0231 family)
VELEYWPVGVADADADVDVEVEEVFEDDDEREVFIEVFVRDEALIVAVDLLLTAGDEDEVEVLLDDDEVEVLVDDDTVAVFANNLVNDNDIEGFRTAMAVAAVALLRTSEVDADAEGGIMLKPSMLIE